MFEPIYNEISKVSFIKKYVNMFVNEKKNKSFACIKTVREEIGQTFNKKILALDPNDPTFEVRKYSI